MKTIVKKYLKNKNELLKKYARAERKYYKKIGNNYATIKMNIELDEKTLKKLFVSLAKSEICFDEFIVSILKTEIVRKEFEKL